MNRHQRKVNKLARYLHTEYGTYSFRQVKVIARQLLTVFEKSPFRK